MSFTVLVSDAPGVGSQIRSRRTELGISQAQLAEQVGVHALTVSAWERNAKAPTEGRLEQIAKALKTTPADLRYGVALTTTGDSRDGGRDIVVRPMRRRMPPRLYELVHGFLTRLADAGVSEEEIDEAERLMVDYSYSKLHSRDSREPTEDDRMLQARAIWSLIEETMRDKGVKL